MSDMTDDEIDALVRDAKPDHDPEVTERVRARVFPTAKGDTRSAFLKWRDEQRYVSEEGCWNAGVEWALASAGVERLEGAVRRALGRIEHFIDDDAVYDADEVRGRLRGLHDLLRGVVSGSPALRVPEEVERLRAENERLKQELEDQGRWLRGCIDGNRSMAAVAKSLHDKLGNEFQAALRVGGAKTVDDDRAVLASASIVVANAERGAIDNERLSAALLDMRQRLAPTPPGGGETCGLWYYFQAGPRCFLPQGHRPPCLYRCREGERCPGHRHPSSMCSVGAAPPREPEDDVEPMPKALCPACQRGDSVERIACERCDACWEVVDENPFPPDADYDEDETAAAWHQRRILDRSKRLDAWLSWGHGIVGTRPEAQAWTFDRDLRDKIEAALSQAPTEGLPEGARWEGYVAVMPKGRCAVDDEGRLYVSQDDGLDLVFETTTAKCIAAVLARKGASERAPTRPWLPTHEQLWAFVDAARDFAQRNDVPGHVARILLRHADAAASILAADPDYGTVSSPPPPKGASDAMGSETAAVVQSKLAALRAAHERLDNAGVVGGPIDVRVGQLLLHPPFGLTRPSGLNPWGDPPGRRSAQAASPVDSKQVVWMTYDEDDGWDEHDDAASAIGAASDILTEYRGRALSDGEWPEGVEHLRVGRFIETHRAVADVGDDGSTEYSIGASDAK